jgi:hypothetical protein
MFLGKCTDKKDDCTTLGGTINTFVDKKVDCVLADADGFISGFAASCLASEKVNKVAGCFEAIHGEAETLFGSDGLFVTVQAAVAEWTGSVVPTPAPPAQCHIPSTAANCSAPADWWAATKCVVNALDATAQGLEKLVVACVPGDMAEKAIKAMLIALAPGEGEIATTCKTLLNFIKVGEAAKSLYGAIEEGNWVLAGAALQEMLSGMIEDWPCDTKLAPPPPSPAAALALGGPLSDVNRTTSSYTAKMSV